MFNNKTADFNDMHITGTYYWPDGTEFTTDTQVTEAPAGQPIRGGIVFLPNPNNPDPWSRLEVTINWTQNGEYVGHVSGTVTR